MLTKSKLFTLLNCTQLSNMKTTKNTHSYFFNQNFDLISKHDKLILIAVINNY